MIPFIIKFFEKFIVYIKGHLLLIIILNTDIVRFPIKI